MPTDHQQLQTIRSQSLAQLAQLRANPKPTYAIDGQTVSWTAYAESLQRTVEWCDAKLADGQPYEFRTQGTN